MWVPTCTRASTGHENGVSTLGAGKLGSLCQSTTILVKKCRRRLLTYSAADATPRPVSTIEFSSFLRQPANPPHHARCIGWDLLLIGGWLVRGLLRHCLGSVSAGTLTSYISALLVHRSRCMRRFFKDLDTAIGTWAVALLAMMGSADPYAD
jgi:hypothetical protein